MTGLEKHADLPERIEQVGHKVLGCAIEVHRHLGPGLLESMYEHALAYELGVAGLASERQVEIRVPYKGMLLPPYRVDLIVESCVIVELKAIDEIVAAHKAQLLSYLRMTGLPLGLLINFNCATLREGVRRVVNERSQSFASRASSLRVQSEGR